MNRHSLAEFLLEFLNYFWGQLQPSDKIYAETKYAICLKILPCIFITCYYLLHFKLISNNHRLFFCMWYFFCIKGTHIIVLVYTGYFTYWGNWLLITCHRKVLWRCSFFILRCVSKNIATFFYSYR